MAVQSPREALGYSTFVLADHVWIYPPIAGLVAAAEATTSLRIGSHVFGNDFRHPALLAREAASIDLLSEGRLELGLGSGYHAVDYQQLGIPLDSPGVRVSRLEEAVQVIKGMWAETPFTFYGRYYTIRDLEGIPKPIQRPRPPLLIGGGGKRTLSLAAREGDIVGIMAKTTADGGFDMASASPDATAQKLEWIRQAAGARFADLELSILISFMEITDAPQAAAERIAGQFRQRDVDIGPEDMRASPHTLIGSVDAIVDALQERRERYGISYYVIREEHMDTFAPALTRLMGT